MTVAKKIEDDKRIKAKAGEFVYVPLFAQEEVGQLNPEEMLERVRAAHRRHGQLDILARIDEGVAANGNPYARKRLVFPGPDRERESGPAFP